MHWHHTGNLLHYQAYKPVLTKVQDIGLSFKTAKDLGNHAEILPTFKPHPHKPHPGQDLRWVSNPGRGLRCQWLSKKINPEIPTKNNVILFYRDPLLCLQYLMLSPFVQDHLSFTPLIRCKSAYARIPRFCRIISA